MSKLCFSLKPEIFDRIRKSQLAHLLGVQTQIVDAYIDGAIDIPVDHLIILCETLNQKMADLLVAEDEKTQDLLIKWTS